MLAVFLILHTRLPDDETSAQNPTRAEPFLAFCFVFFARNNNLTLFQRNARIHNGRLVCRPVSTPRAGATMLHAPVRWASAHARHKSWADACCIVNRVMQTSV